MNLFPRFKLLNFMMVSFILSSSCNTKQESRINEPLYFNINKFVEDQAKTLSVLRPIVEKELSFDTLKQKKVFKHINWVEELKVFKEGDINSPVLRETYNTKKIDDKDIYRIKYTPKEALKKGVVELTITYDRRDKVVKAIYFKLISKNLLYTSARDFHLTFTTENKNSLLKTYRIRNYQDIIFKRPVETNLFTKITYSSLL